MISLPIDLRPDATALTAAIAELEDLLSKLPEGVAKRFVRLFDPSKELCRVRGDHGPAAGAGVVRIFLEPGDGLLGLLSALRAGDLDGLVGEGALDAVGHESNSVGSVGTTNVAGDPGAAPVASGETHTNPRWLR